MTFLNKERADCLHTRKRLSSQHWHSILPHIVQVPKSTRFSLKMVVTLRQMSLCVASLNTTVQPYLLSSFCTGQCRTTGGCSGTEAKAQGGDSGGSGKVVPGLMRGPWLRRSGRRLAVDWRNWQLLPHSLEHLQEYLGSFYLIFK